MSSCFSSENRWKNDDACMAAKRPLKGVSVVSSDRTGAGSEGTATAGGDAFRKASSKASPGMNGTGKVSGVLPNSW